jgi:hypothetical protein
MGMMSRLELKIIKGRASNFKNDDFNVLLTSVRSSNRVRVEVNIMYTNSTVDWSRTNVLETNAGNK